MRDLAEQERFEEAALARDRLRALAEALARAHGRCLAALGRPSWCCATTTGRRFRIRGGALDREATSRAARRSVSTRASRRGRRPAGLDRAERPRSRRRTSRSPSPSTAAASSTGSCVLLRERDRSARRSARWSARRTPVVAWAHAARTELLTDQLRRGVRDLAAGASSGVTDEEFVWEPAPGNAWRVFRDESGRWTHDYAEPDPHPVPFTTIGWRLAARRDVQGDVPRVGVRHSRADVAHDRDAARRRGRARDDRTRARNSCWTTSPL